MLKTLAILWLVLVCALFGSVVGETSYLIWKSGHAHV